MIVDGNIASKTMTLPAGSVKNSAWSSTPTDRLSPDNMVLPIVVRHVQAAGADVATKTEPCHAAHADGTLEAVDIFVTTAPTGGDKAFTVDFQKSTGGGAFATMFSAVVTINSSKTAKTVYPATLAAGVTYVAGDVFQWVITASGSTGSQGQGLCCVAKLRENPA
jgi:hypothetical protein